MAKRYRITPFVRANNAVIATLLRLGLNLGGFALLTVRGRKSGRPIETPVAIFVQGDARYLIAAYGEVNWVRNLRAADGVVTLTQARRAQTLHAAELSPHAAASILRDSLRSGPPGIPPPLVRGYRRFFVLPYLNVTADSSLEEFIREAATHPVFLLHPA